MDKEKNSTSSHEEEVKKAELVLKKKEMDLYEQLIQNQVKKSLFKSSGFWVGLGAVVVILGMIYAGQLYRQELIQNNMKQVAIIRQSSQEQILEVAKRYKAEVDSLKNQITQIQKQNQENIGNFKQSNQTSVNALEKSLDNSIEQNKQLNKTNEYLKYIIAGLSQKLGTK